jgi:uncharacterized protein YegL
MKTEIICITDGSGSMSGLRGDVVGGFNAFVAEQRAIPGEARMTLVQFNSGVNTLYQAKPLGEVATLALDQYCPMGGTALLDAIGTTLEQQGKRIAAENWAEAVIVSITTDGEENSSSHYSLEQVKAMITHAQDKAGWVFVFQAANQDAFLAGGQYGISAGTTHSFTASAAGVRDSYATMSMSATALRTAAVAGTPLPPLPDATLGLTPTTTP